jgi:hypothetical protein
MTKYFKIETSILLISLLIYFALIKDFFNPTLYLNLILVVGIYFFPVKVIINRKSSDLLLILISSFIITVTLVLSYVTYVLENTNNSLKLILLIDTLINLIIIYKMISVKNKLYIYHFILLLFIVMTLYK